jgi:hypothetical protein
MRKLMMIVTLAMSFLAFTGSSVASPPQCGDLCPFVR